MEEKRKKERKKGKNPNYHFNLKIVRCRVARWHDSEQFFFRQRNHHRALLNGETITKSSEEVILLKEVGGIYSGFPLMWLWEFASIFCSKKIKKFILKKILFVMSLLKKKN